jgi:CubicO group peptidase (beta-lactamase class C family)
MSTQNVYFINPNTVTNLDNNVTTLTRQTDLHLPLRTDLNHITEFMTGSLGLYTDMKNIACTVGQVSPSGEFSYFYGSRSVLVNSTGGNNLTGSNVSRLYAGGNLIQPINAFGEAIADDNNYPLDENTYFPSYSVGNIYTSATFQILCDKGIIRSNDPIIRFFPTWKNMKVLTQRFFTNGTGCYSQTGTLGSPATFLSAGTGTDLDALTVTLTTGQTDTITNFLSSGLVQLVDTSILPTATGAGGVVNINALAANPTGPQSRYYIETQPIQILKEKKTFGTVAMAFSHQIGLGLFTSYNQLAINVLRDRGLVVQNFNNISTTPQATIDALYPSGYRTHNWMNDVLSAGILSSQPGKVWEYNTGICIGIACCEIAYQQFYKLTEPKPFWQIMRELLLTPCGITNDVILKESEIIAYGSNTGAFKNSVLAMYGAAPAGPTVLGNVGGSLYPLAYRNAALIHDIFLAGCQFVTMPGLVKVAYMLANYGVAKNGTRVMSKSAVKAMCETNYLDTNLDMVAYDESNIDMEALRWSITPQFAMTEALSYGLGGAIFRARPGKVLNAIGTSLPDDWYMWSGAGMTTFYVKPSEGKYIVTAMRNIPLSNTSAFTFGINAGSSVVYFGGLNAPAAYDNYGINAFLSAYNF